MPYPGFGSSYVSWLIFNIAGTTVNVGANTYNDLIVAIPELSNEIQGQAQFVLAQAPAVHAASPQLMISYVWLQDPTHVGIRWMNTTGGTVTVPATTYSILVLI